MFPAQKPGESTMQAKIQKFVMRQQMIDELGLSLQETA
jgi:hypothetical protein